MPKLEKFQVEELEQTFVFYIFHKLFCTAKLYSYNSLNIHRAFFYQ